MTAQLVKRLNQVKNNEQIKSKGYSSAMRKKRKTFQKWFILQTGGGFGLSAAV